MFLFELGRRIFLRELQSTPMDAALDVSFFFMCRDWSFLLWIVPKSLRILNYNSDSYCAMLSAAITSDSVYPLHLAG
jgi:hypothetical protein